jgi:hypothetical protein
MGRLNEKELEKRMNMTVINKKGYKAKILNYRKWDDIDLIFEDGVILHNTYFSSFKTGNFAHPETKNCKDLTGLRFGRLVVLHDSGKRTKAREIIWSCKCDCGNHIDVRGANLKDKMTQSCGCLSKEKSSECILDDETASINRVIQNYKRGASKRGLVWELSYDEVKKLILSSCHYCGQTETNFTKVRAHQKGIKHIGIDRVDSSKGYTVGNVVPCCKLCNQAKNDLSEEEFYEWIYRVSSHLKDRTKKQ